MKAGHDVLTIDKLTYAGNLAALGEVKDLSNHRFIKADINDAALVDAAFRDFKPDAVVHLAAESHVDRSLDEPAAFLTTNVLGTFVLLGHQRKRPLHAVVAMMRVPPPIHWLARSNKSSAINHESISGRPC